MTIISVPARISRIETRVMPAGLGAMEIRWPPFARLTGNEPFCWTA